MTILVNLHSTVMVPPGIGMTVIICLSTNYNLYASPYHYRVIMLFYFPIQIYSIADGLKTHSLVDLIQTPKSVPPQQIFITWEASLESFSSPVTLLIATGGDLYREHTSLAKGKQRKLCNALKAIAKSSGQRETLFKKFTSTHEVHT